MIQGAKDVRGLEQTKSTASAGGSRTDNQLGRYRTQALKDWGSEGRDMVEEARRKERGVGLTLTRSKAGEQDRRPPAVKP